MTTSLKNYNIGKESLQLILFPSIILVCFTAAYWSAFQKMAIRWSSGDNKYWYLIIPLFI